jgi:hypothetical protein
MCDDWRTPQRPHGTQGTSHQGSSGSAVDSSTNLDRLQIRFQAMDIRSLDAHASVSFPISEDRLVMTLFILSGQLGLFMTTDTNMSATFCPNGANTARRLRLRPSTVLVMPASFAGFGRLRLPVGSDASARSWCPKPYNSPRAIVRPRSCRGVGTLSSSMRITSSVLIFSLSA